MCGSKNGAVLPTRVGMVRRTRRTRVGGGGSPHTRGDGPQFCNSVGSLELFSPHAWGWSVWCGENPLDRIVLPTRVGMVRLGPWRLRLPQSSPHTRGDGPSAWRFTVPSGKFSPHAWGWSGLDATVWNRVSVLPTRVGMVRQKLLRASVVYGSPHTRGDGPRPACS